MPFVLQKKLDPQTVQKKADAIGTKDPKRHLAGMGFEAAEAALAPDKGAGGGQVQAVARAGMAGGGQSVPHQRSIQAAFGRHDVSGVEAHTGGPAAEACDTLGASAFASGSAVAFKGQPDLHTAAHEMAHVVQQRGGVDVPGGVGQRGDAHEKHADAVADAVVQGKSAEGLLDRYGDKGGSAGDAVQRKAVQFNQTGDGEQVDHSREKKRTVKAFFGKVGAGIKDSNLAKALGRGSVASQRMFMGDDHGNSIWSSPGKLSTAKKFKLAAMRVGMGIGLTLFPTFTMSMAMVGNTIATNRAHKRDKKRNRTGRTYQIDPQQVLRERVSNAVLRADLSKLTEAKMLMPDVEEMLRHRLQLGGKMPDWNEEQMQIYASIEEAIREVNPTLDKAFVQGGVQSLKTQSQPEEGGETIDLDHDDKKQEGLLN